MNFIILKAVLGLQCNPNDNQTGGDLLCNTWNYLAGRALSLSLEPKQVARFGGHEGAANKGGSRYREARSRKAALYHHVSTQLNKNANPVRMQKMVQAIANSHSGK